MNKPRMVSRVVEYSFLAVLCLVASSCGCPRTRPGDPGLSAWLRRADASYDAPDRVRIPGRIGSLPEGGLSADVWIWQGRQLGVDEQVLLRLIDEHSDEPLLDAIVYALGQFASQDSLPVLYEMLDSKDAGVRYQAVSVLGTWHVDAAVNRLCEVATKDGASNVRGCAIYALSEIGGDQALRCVRAATNDPSPYVVLQAKQAVLRMEHREMVEASDTERLVGGGTRN